MLFNQYIPYCLESGAFVSCRLCLYLAPVATSPPPQSHAGFAHMDHAGDFRPPKLRPLLPSYLQVQTMAALLALGLFSEDSDTAYKSLTDFENGKGIVGQEIFAISLRQFDELSVG